MKAFKKNFLRYFFLTLANLIAAINFNLLAKPINLVSGGSPGLALVVSKIVNLSTSDIVTIIYVITFILSMILLGKDVLFGIIFASVVYPIFVYATENITSLITFNYTDIFLVTIIAGILSGVSNGMIYKNGFASSGIAVIAPILNKYFKISISLANFIVNTIIILLGGYFFGFNIILLAMCYIYISSFVCNRIILGVSRNKVLLIYSKKYLEILELLKNKYHLNATIFEEQDNNMMIMIVLNNVYYFNLKRDLVKLDDNVFFTTNDCYEVKKISNMV